MAVARWGTPIELAALGDLANALLIGTSGTASATAVDGRVAGASAAYLATAPAVAAAAAAAASSQVGAEIIARDLVAGVDPRIRQTYKDTGFDAVYGDLDLDDRPMWTTSNIKGEPSSVAMEILVRVLSPYWGGGGSGGGSDTRGSRVVGLGSASKPANREYPIFTNPRTTPLLSLADQGASSLFWPQLVDLTEGGGSGLAVLWSTDHATTHAASGIYWATITNPTATPVYQGQLYRDDNGGNQCETPSIVWNPVTSLWHMYYQMARDKTANLPPGVADQVTLLATSPNFTTWTRVGVVVDAPADTSVPGQNIHQGYFNPFRFGGAWYATNVGGGTYGAANMLQSMDGITWRRTGHLPAGGSFIRHFAGYDPETWRISWNNVNFIDWRGRIWAVVPIGGGAAGLEESPPQRLGVAPMNAAMTRPATPFVDITPTPQAWEASHALDGFGRGCVVNGKYTTLFRSNTKTGAFGVLEGQ